MKVKFLALALAVSSAMANAAVENTYSAGFNAGWNHAYDVKFADYQNSSDNEGYELSLNGEYNFTSWFSLGAAYDYQGGNEFRFNGSSKELHSNALDVYARFAYPVDDLGSDLFFKTGAGYVKTSMDGDSHKRFAPILGVGAQYALTENMAVRAGYDFKFGSSKFDNGSKVNNGDLYVGFEYTFGASKTAPVTVAAAPAKSVRRVTQKHNLSAGMLFPFDGAELSNQGKEAVASIVKSTSALENANYEVYGYTDRIGSDAYNNALSVKRANAVAGELANNGASPISVVEGRGKSNSVTGDKCSGIKNRNELIDCLSADRRVEVIISGDTTTEENN